MVALYQYGRPVAGSFITCHDLLHGGGHDFVDLEQFERKDGRLAAQIRSRVLLGNHDVDGDDFVGRDDLPKLTGNDGLSAKQQATVRLFAKYLSDANRAALGAGGFTVVYNEYDWALNKQ